MGTHGPVIVVGVDRSPHSAAALRWAAEEATRRNAGLRVVHAWQLAGGGDVQTQSATEQQATVGWVSDLLEDLPLPYSVEAVEGAPGPVLIDLSAAAELLVVGTGEHVGVDRLLHGSISHYCVTNAVCPVVSVPSHVTWQPHSAGRMPHPAAET